MNKEELLDLLKYYTSTVNKTITISLINFIEDEEIEVTDELLQYLYDGIKDLEGVKPSRLVNCLVTTISIQRS
jgi:hypothetical protein